MQATALKSDTFAQKFEKRHNLPARVIQYWKERGFDVGPDGEGLVNGMPESLSVVKVGDPRVKTPKQALRQDLRGSNIRIDLLRHEVGQLINVCDALRADLQKKDARLNHLEDRYHDLKRRLDIFVNCYDGAKTDGPRIDMNTKLGLLCAEVSSLYGVSIEDIRGASRLRCHVAPRIHLAWLIDKTLNWSLGRIGYFLDNRDHTTVLNALKRFNHYVETGRIKPFDVDFDALRERHLREGGT